MVELIKVQKANEDLIISIPKEICEKLDIKEGMEVEIEPFICAGQPGARIRLKGVD